MYFTRIKNKMNKLIKTVVYNFYNQAISDVFLGYHFKKIISKEEAHLLTPPIESFSKHLTRIEYFWANQLLGTTPPEGLKFNLIPTHKNLGIKKGELGRWITLFKQTLEKAKNSSLDSSDLQLIETWELKIDQFNDIFISRLFTHPQKLF